MEGMVEALDVLEWWRAAWRDQWGVAYESRGQDYWGRSHESNGEFEDLQALVRLISMKGNAYATQHLLFVELRAWAGQPQGWGALGQICRSYKRQDFEASGSTDPSSADEARVGGE